MWPPIYLINRDHPTPSLLCSPVMLLPWRLPWGIVISGQLVTLSFKCPSGCKESTFLWPHFWQPLSYAKHLHLCMLIVPLKPWHHHLPVLHQFCGPYLCCRWEFTSIAAARNCSLFRHSFIFLMFLDSSTILKDAAHPEGRIKAGAQNLNAFLCQPSWISQLFFTR